MYFGSMTLGFKNEMVETIEAFIGHLTKTRYIVKFLMSGRREI